MNAKKIRTTIEKALAAALRVIDVRSIAKAELRSLQISSRQMRSIIAQLEKHHSAEITLGTKVELLVRISNSDVLVSTQRIDFRIVISADDDDIRASATNKKTWRKAWESAIEPIKEAALVSMRQDVRSMDPDIPDDSSFFQAAMVLLASEMVGPYVDEVATFLGYPVTLVRTFATRLCEAGIWENDEVRCESWFDHKTGAISFMLHILAAEGLVINRRSEKNGNSSVSAHHLRRRHDHNRVGALSPRAHQKREG